MLLATFQHLKGIGVKREVDLWGSGIFSWDDLEKYQKRQLSLFPSFQNGTSSPLFFSSRKAIEEKDAEHFALSLPRQEHYRIALSFPAHTLFLDIETTGLSRYYDTVTVVGWSMAQEYHVYVKGDDDCALRRALETAKVIVTFNGTLFDLPFLCQEDARSLLPKIFKVRIL